MGLSGNTGPGKSDRVNHKIQPLEGWAGRFYLAVPGNTNLQSF
jgi:hypothetical protein